MKLIEKTINSQKYEIKSKKVKIEDRMRLSWNSSWNLRPHMMNTFLERILNKNKKGRKISIKNRRWTEICLQ